MDLGLIIYSIIEGRKGGSGGGKVEVKILTARNSQKNFRSQVFHFHLHRVASTSFNMGWKEPI